VGQGESGFPLTALPEHPVQTEFNHAANDSPRSGSSKKVTPVIWAVIVLAVIAVTIWYAMHA
jgi:hypothetical protein